MIESRSKEFEGYNTVPLPADVIERGRDSRVAWESARQEFWDKCMDYFMWFLVVVVTGLGLAGFCGAFWTVYIPWLGRVLEWAWGIWRT